MIGNIMDALAGRDERPHKGCWAPGQYTCKCCHCGDMFIGHKRAVSCAPCAYAIEGEVEEEV